MSLSLVLLGTVMTTLAQEPLNGKVMDSATNDVVIGAVVVVMENPAKVVASDIDGNFTIEGVELPATLQVSYAGNKTVEVRVESYDNITVTLEPDAIGIESVQVVRRRRQNTETAMIASLRQTNAVAVGISSTQISKTSDSDAGEVVKRIPGISMIDGRFIVVRGLAQRYNNVWINGGSVPSTEADGRAFSFDIIPSSNIDNIVISKSFTADLPGDFSGGFINISTKGVADKGSVKLSIGTGINSISTFNDVTMGYRSSTEWMGFDNSRNLGSDFPSNLGSVTDATQLTNLYNNGFNSDWSTSTFRPLPDIKASVQWESKLSEKLSMVLSANYQTKYSSTLNEVNRRYALYDTDTDESVLEKDYIDNKYAQEVNFGAMNNWVFQLNPENKFEFHNLFNVMGKNSFGERTGFSTVSGDYYQRELEYFYSSRLTYTGQLSGNHKFGADNSNIFDWNGTYSYAYRDEPDRRIVLDQANYAPAEGESMYVTDSNISRYFEELSDNIFSGALNYKKSFMGDNWMPTLKAGLFAEYRDRNYSAREFTYMEDNLNQSQKNTYFNSSLEERVSSEWVGQGSGLVYMDESGSKQNSYTGEYFVGAGYVTTTLPIGKFIFDVGARVELWNMNLRYDKSLDPSYELMVDNNYNELSILPALNIAYNVNKRHTLRTSYGRTVNRPEFREVSPSVYYDYDLNAEVQGNTELEMAVIDNLDLRYEYYPTAGEIISVGVFYKHFTNPIEWTFTDMGGTYRYSYENADAAYSAGVEVDIRKRLDFLGVPELAFVFNGAYVISEVEFKNEGLVTQRSRPLQGQSPYIINAGFYYDSKEELGLSASILYNVIGKRIMGIGKTTTIDASDLDSYLPDSYEMPRNMLDLTIGKTFGKRFEAKLGIKNLLNSPVVLMQFPTITVDGVQYTREQVTREYREGISASLSLSVKF